MQEPKEPIAEERKFRILLVDDNLESRLVIRLFLKAFPWELVDATNGEEALARVREARFDLILMDMQMPVMDGHTATRRIRQYWEDSATIPSPIIALTARGLAEDMLKSLEAGCHAHVTKPVVREELVRAIRDYSGDITVAVDRDLASMIPLYLSKRFAEMGELREALRRGDLKSVEGIGHKLVGAAGSYGFPELGELGRSLEAAAQKKQLSTLWHLFSQYELYLSRLKVTIRD